MAEFRFSRKARADLIDIAIYGFEHFGFIRSRNYRDNLVSACGLLALYPDSGIDCHYVRKAMRRLVHRSHVIYYRKSTAGIAIYRILHHSQDPLRHL